MKSLSMSGPASRKTGFGGGTDLTGVFSGEWINDQNVIDIPLDPLALGFAATDADRFLTIDKVNVQVFDTLPFGFRYVPGSTLLRGEPAPDPIRADNGNYIFDVGTIEVEETAELRYARQRQGGDADQRYFFKSGRAIWQSVCRPELRWPAKQ